MWTRKPTGWKVKNFSMICEIQLLGYFINLSEKSLQTFILFGVFVLQYIVEHIFPQAKKFNNLKNEGFNLLIALINAAVIFVPSVWMVEWLNLIDKKNWGILQQFKFALWIQIIVTIILMDLVMYWWHRFNHTYRILWRFHRFHHRDEMMNSTTALRFHSVELLFSVIFKSLVFLLLGFAFLPVLIYETIFFIAVVIHHSNFHITERFDMLYRKLFSSPLMHRIHHSNKQKETDTNYGSVFSFWDRIFKTYLKEPTEPVVFGVEEKQN